MPKRIFQTGRVPTKRDKTKKACVGVVQGHSNTNTVYKEMFPVDVVLSDMKLFPEQEVSLSVVGKGSTITLDSLDSNVFVQAGSVVTVSVGNEGGLAVFFCAEVSKDA